MPFLRFTRDKRGYETTSLVEPGRGNGRSRDRVLYWFRTPPAVKVGRPALDETAIRIIEEQNPDITFDWPRILEGQPTAPPLEDPRNRRVRRDRPRPAAPAARRPPRSTPAERPGPPAIDVKLPETEDFSQIPEIAEDPDLVEPESFEPDAPEPDLDQALEQLTQPDVEEKVGAPVRPLDRILSSEELTRLRARYAELLARIVERGGDPSRVDALRAEAEALNPETWVTPEEVQRGIQSFEPKIRDLRAALGLRRRRRSRRGGRRRRGEGQAVPAPGSDSGGQ